MALGGEMAGHSATARHPQAWAFLLLLLSSCEGQGPILPVT